MSVSPTVESLRVRETNSSLDLRPPCHVADVDDSEPDVVFNWLAMGAALAVAFVVLPPAVVVLATLDRWRAWRAGGWADVAMVDSYVFKRDALALLLTKTFFPERTNRESTIIIDFLRARGERYDTYEFSTRVGQGQTPDPSHLEGVQRNTVFSTRKRIDMIVWVGNQPTIIEVKERVSPAVLGQLTTYRHLLLEDRPGIPDPWLMSIGRYSDDDTLRVLAANGVEVILYDKAD